MSGDGEHDPDDLVSTGVLGVDAVIESVAGLDARPLDEHADVFESAQERLRRALDVPDTTS